MNFGMLHLILLNFGGRVELKLNSKLPVFDAEDLKCLDWKYFQVINVNECDVTIMSRNTEHFWYLHNSEYPEKGTGIISHKHRASNTYHHHGRANTLWQAVRSIRRHDIFQLNGRKSD